MRILILGGTRFVGPHVVRRLADHGHDVTIFHRGNTETDLPPNVRHVHGDFATVMDEQAAGRIYNVALGEAIQTTSAEGGQRESK